MKNVLVIGLGKSGFATAGLLADEAHITCWDSKEEEKFDAAEIAALREKGVQFVFGEAPSAKGTAILTEGSLWKGILFFGIPLIASNLLQIRQALALPDSVLLIPFSAETGQGREDLLTQIVKIL